jgi:hypothetical protein
MALPASAWVIQGVVASANACDSLRASRPIPFAYSSPTILPVVAATTLDDCGRTKRASSVMRLIRLLVRQRCATFCIERSPQRAGPIVSATRWFEATAARLLGIRKERPCCRTAWSLYHAENPRVAVWEKLEGVVYDSTLPPCARSGPGEPWNLKSPPTPSASGNAMQRSSGCSETPAAGTACAAGTIRSLRCPLPRP